MPRYMVESTDQIVAVEFPFELMRNIYTPLSDAMMKMIVDYRTYGDEQQSIALFNLYMDLTRSLRYWETNSRSPF